MVTTEWLTPATEQDMTPEPNDCLVPVGAICGEFLCGERVCGGDPLWLGQSHCTDQTLQPAEVR